MAVGDAENAIKAWSEMISNNIHAYLRREEAVAQRAAGAVWVLLLAGVALLASACATPVGVTRVDTSTAYRTPV